MRNGNIPLQPLASDLLLHNEDSMGWQQQEKRASPKKTSRDKKRNILLEELYDALHKRCMKQPPPAFNEWISTRVLAEDCELGIYQTRSLLLKLVDQQKVMVTPTPIANSLRWYIAVEGETLSFAGK